MSDELKLPDRLAACEAELAARPLAASTINRDELMYRAGWAAAEAARAPGRESAAVAARAGRKPIAIWSAASAAAAAVLATAVTWSIATSMQPTTIVATGVERPSSADPAARAATRPSRSATDDQRPAPRDASALLFWFVSRQLPLRSLDQRTLAASDVATLTPAVGTRATARQLLNEYLPVRDAYGAGRDTPVQGILKLLHPQTWKGDAI